VVGVVREISGGWVVTLWLMLLIALLSSLAGLQLAKKRFIEDEIAI